MARFILINIMNEKILSGHYSPASAYVVDDYPYGFSLRCKIRYWLEYKAGKGVRFVSQTTNPKVAGEVWNKPKASTFCRFGGCMFLNEEGHIRWAGLTEYTDGATAQAWVAQYGAGNPEACKETTRLWLVQKCAYDAARAAGKDMGEATIAARVAAVAESSTLTEDRAKEGLRVRRKADIGNKEAGAWVLKWSAQFALWQVVSESGIISEGLPLENFGQWYICKPKN